MEKEAMIRLVKAAQQGDGDAAGKLYSAFYSDIYFFINKTVQDASLAEDLTQDTFVDILSHIGDLQEPAAFPKWIRSTAYHRCTGHFKRRKELLADENEEGGSIFDTVTEDREEFIPDEALDHKELRDTIARMVDALPAEQRSAILLRYFEELSVGDIAAIQNVSEGTVKSRLNYGRKAIKGAVEDWERKSGTKLRCAGIVPLLLWLFWPRHRENSAARLQELAPGAACPKRPAAPKAVGAALNTKLLAGIVAGVLVLTGAILALTRRSPGDAPAEPDRPGVMEEDPNYPESDYNEPDYAALDRYGQIVSELNAYAAGAECYTINPVLSAYHPYQDIDRPSNRDMEDAIYLGAYYAELMDMAHLDPWLSDPEFLAGYYSDPAVCDRQTLLSRFQVCEDVLLEVCQERIQGNGDFAEYSDYWEYNPDGTVAREKLSFLRDIFLGTDIATANPNVQYTPYHTTNEYTYENGRLVSAVSNPDKPHAIASRFIYDDSGRILQEDYESISSSYGGDALPRSRTFTYDEQGNLLYCEWKDVVEYTDRNVAEFTYDGQGNLLTGTLTVYTAYRGENGVFELLDHTERVEHSYDADGRRISSQYFWCQADMGTPGQEIVVEQHSYTHDAQGRILTDTVESFSPQDASPTQTLLRYYYYGNYATYTP